MYIYIRRPLDRGATRLRRICCILYPLSYVSLYPCIYILLFLYPACCRSYPVSWILHLALRSVAWEPGCYHPPPVIPGSWGRPKAASPPAASQPPASQPASQHPAASSQDRGWRQGRSLKIYIYIYIYTCICICTSIPLHFCNAQCAGTGGTSTGRWPEHGKPGDLARGACCRAPLA
jgi:hypothetical protein